LRRFVFDPGLSQVWIDGSSSIHPVRATATGVTGWIALALSEDRDPDAADLAGEVRVAVDRLSSGNRLIDQETKRRIDATRHPEIVGTVTAARRVASNRLTITGDIAFRGEVQSVSGDIEVSVEHDRVVVEGAQTFDVRKWGLRLPRLGLLRVHPDVRVRVHLVADNAERGVLERPATT
jgi:polyisoprenoid-binding protein YceI